jgi:hypothetical protein
VVKRYNWIGEKHTNIYQQIKYIVEEWEAQYLVIDSTGVGQGLASFLEKSYPGRVIPYLFTSKSKSDLGWGFLAVIETGRFKEMVNSQTQFWNQVKHCGSEVLSGPGQDSQMMRWGVPDGTRDELTGDLVHDDELIGSGLCSVFDGLEWAISSSPIVIDRVDPLTEMDKEGF